MLLIHGITKAVIIAAIRAITAFAMLVRSIVIVCILAFCYVDFFFFLDPADDYFGKTLHHHYAAFNHDGAEIPFDQNGLFLPRDKE